MDANIAIFSYIYSYSLGNHSRWISRKGRVPSSAWSEQPTGPRGRMSCSRQAEMMQALEGFLNGLRKK